MKKIVALFLSLMIVVPLGGCERKKPVSLTTENISDYVCVDIIFGLVRADKEVSKFSTTYYYSCPITIKIYPIGNYSFSNTQITVSLKDESTNKRQWELKPLFINSAYGKNNYSTSLDGNGYAEIPLVATISRFNINIPNEAETTPPPEEITGAGIFPSTSSWSKKIVSVSGTVTQN